MSPLCCRFWCRVRTLVLLFSLYASSLIWFYKSSASEILRSFRHVQMLTSTLKKNPDLFIYFIPQHLEHV